MKNCNFIPIDLKPIKKEHFRSFNKNPCIFYLSIELEMQNLSI